MKKNAISTFAICIILLITSFACKNKTASGQPSKVSNATLIISSAGNLFNFNLDENKVAWEYTSKFDTEGNRNHFAVDGDQIFMPFESGKFISFDINTGKIIWQNEIFGKENDAIDMSSDEDQQAEMLKDLKPLFMTTPLVDGANVLINSAGKPEQSMGYLYNFNKKTGERLWAGELPTVFNYYAPVKYRNNYFVNSAVYLEMFTPKSGTPTSYGMFESMPEIAGEAPMEQQPPNQFQNPIYCQMQTDGESVFIGDEKGKFYCFQLDKNGSVTGGDISEPNNTFIKNPSIFKWTFSDKDFSFQKNGISYLTNKALFVEMKTGVADKSCLFAIDPENGKLIWKKVVDGDIKNWNLQDGKIAGSTGDVIFWMDAKGQNYTEVKSESKPISNIAFMDQSQLIYITTNGIEIFDTKSKKANLVFKKLFPENEFNNVQVKFLGK